MQALAENSRPRSKSFENLRIVGLLRSTCHYALARVLITVLMLPYLVVESGRRSAHRFGYSRPKLHESRSKLVRYCRNSCKTNLFRFPPYTPYLRGIDKHKSKRVYCVTGILYLLLYYCTTVLLYYCTTVYIVMARNLIRGKSCGKCGEIKPLTEFILVSKAKGGVYGHCKDCTYKYQKERLDNNPRLRMLQSSYGNAKTKGIEHAIKLRHVPLPETCIYLGICLDYRCASERGRLRSYNAPSIDRIDSSKGYIPGNIQVISDLANRMKQNATVEQLLAFAEGILRVHGGK